MRLVSLGFIFSFSTSRVFPLRGSSHKVRGHCHPYALLWRGVSKFKPPNLNAAVSQAFLSAEASAGKARPFPAAVPAAGLQTERQSPCSCAKRHPPERRGGMEGGQEGGGMLGLAPLSKRAFGKRWLEIDNLQKLVLGPFNDGSEVLNPHSANSAGSNLFAFVCLFI